MKNNLFFYSILMIFYFNNRIYSQIVYTDIDDITPNASFALDLNNDSIIDFIIQFELNNKVVCFPQNNNAYSGNFVEGKHLPWAFSAFNTICETQLTWYNSSNPGTLAMGTSIGYWVGETNKYLALKLIVGSNTYYGWLRLDMQSASLSFTVKDYAYQSTPNTCIITGQTTLGINENFKKNEVSIFFDSYNSTAIIQSNNNLTNATLTIYNTFGQKIKQIYNINGKNHVISIENLYSGLHFIQLNEGNELITLNKLILPN